MKIGQQFSAVRKALDSTYLRMTVCFLEQELNTRIQPDEAQKTDLAAMVKDMETLLARNLVFDHGAAEDGLDALGGWNRMCDLVTAYREANPLPLSVSDGEEPF